VYVQAVGLPAACFPLFVFKVQLAANCLSSWTKSRPPDL